MLRNTQSTLYTVLPYFAMESLQCTNFSGQICILCCCAQQVHVHPGVKEKVVKLLPPSGYQVKDQAKKDRNMQCPVVQAITQWQ